MLVFGAAVAVLGALLALDLGGAASRLASLSRSLPPWLNGPAADYEWAWRGLGGLVAAIGLVIVIVQVLGRVPGQ